MLCRLFQKEPYHFSPLSLLECGFKILPKRGLISTETSQILPIGLLYMYISLTLSWIKLRHLRIFQAGDVSCFPVARDQVTRQAGGLDWMGVGLKHLGGKLSLEVPWLCCVVCGCFLCVAFQGFPSASFGLRLRVAIDLLPSYHTVLSFPAPRRDSSCLVRLSPGKKQGVH